MIGSVPEDGNRKPRLLEQPGFFIGGPIQDLQPTVRVSCHDGRRLSSSASGNRCPTPARLYSVNGFVICPLAVRSFISAVIVIADSGIAVRVAARNPAANNAVRPTAVISKARRGGSIIGITSATTANGRLKPA
jgi:hypothetical protein